jgi:hypothetical protein
LQSILEFVRKQVIKLHLHYGENRAKLAGFKNAKILLFKTHKLSVFCKCKWTYNCLISNSD